MAKEEMMGRSVRQLTFTASMALVALASAGAALSGSPNDQAGAIGVGAVPFGATAQAPDWFERAALRGDASARPDDRAETRGPGAMSVATPAQTPDWFERAALRGRDELVSLRSPSAVPAVSLLPAASAAEGFRWSDAVVGSGFTLALLAVAGLVGLTIRHRARPMSA